MRPAPAQADEETAIAARKRPRVSLPLAWHALPLETEHRRAMFVRSSTVRSKPHAHSASVAIEFKPIPSILLVIIHAAARELAQTLWAQSRALTEPHPMDSNNVLELLRAQVLPRNDELPPHVFLDPTGHADTTRERNDGPCAARMTASCLSVNSGVSARGPVYPLTPAAMLHRSEWTRLHNRSHRPLQQPARVDEQCPWFQPDCLRIYSSLTVYSTAMECTEPICCGH